MKSLLSRDISSIDAVIPRPKLGNIKRVSPTARITGTGHSPDDGVSSQCCSQRLWLKPSIKDLGHVRWVRQDANEMEASPLLTFTNLGDRCSYNLVKVWEVCAKFQALTIKKSRTNINKLSMRFFFQKWNICKKKQLHFQHTTFDDRPQCFGSSQPLPQRSACDSTDIYRRSIQERVNRSS